MPKYGRRSSSYAKRPKGRRFKSKRRTGYKRKAVTMQMLRRVVPKPELKYSNTLNGTGIQATPFFATWADYQNVFLIPQGAGLGERVGDKVYIKRIWLQFESRAAANIAYTTLSTGTSTGTPATADRIAIPQKNQALRIVWTDENWNRTGGAPSDDLELMGDSQSGSLGGAASYNYQLDKAMLKSKGIHVYKDVKIVHSVGQKSATGGEPFGLPKPIQDQKVHSLSLSFPGKGKLLQYDSNSTILPARFPLIRICGENDATADNPFYRLRVARVWFTDP